MTDTPVFFSREEVRRIREMFKTPEASVECPRCGRALTLRGPIKSESGELTMFQVNCKPCRRTAIITQAAAATTSEQKGVTHGPASGGR